uniref:Uncharacterized protein n=1 Tax=Poecilia latipinna TaxID=48699 RepID=A0A3B3VBF4_9TELE
MKIQVVAVLILALSAAEISETLNFFQKHVVKSMNPRSCDSKMKRINAAERWCKPINTNFLDPEGVLNGIFEIRFNYLYYMQLQSIFPTSLISFKSHLISFSGYVRRDSQQLVCGRPCLFFPLITFSEHNSLI